MKKQRLIITGAFFIFNAVLFSSFAAQANPLPVTPKFTLKSQCACGPTVTMINSGPGITKITEYWENFEGTDSRTWTFTPSSFPFQLEAIYGGNYTLSFTFADPQNASGTLVAKDFNGYVIATEDIGYRTAPFTFSAYCGPYTVEID